MAGSALALALAAAVLHAVWNLLLARARDVEAATAGAFAIAVGLFAPMAAVRWDIAAEAVPFMAVSAAFELLYLGLLAFAYAHAELSVVYPVARGLAPVLVLGVGVAALGVGTSTVEACGVVLVALGVLLVRGLRAGDSRGTVYGVEHADPLAYLVVVLALPVAVYLAIIVRRRGVDSLRRELGPAMLVAAPATFGAFALTLFALQRASAASVAAVRETSVVIAVALAAPVLGEHVTRGRLAGAVVVVIGVAVLATG
jgi:drug/metabolite transporter (DMT)-like permease